jgi:hypothetical protein
MKSFDNDTPFEILMDHIPIMDVRSLVEKEVSFIYKPQHMNCYKNFGL